MDKYHQPQKQINMQILTQQFICPITYQMMVDPVTVQSGHTFERQAITQWIRRGNKKNPKTGKIMKSTVLYPNRLIKNLIEKFPRIISSIRKQTGSLESRLKDLQNLWQQADISDSTIRRQKVKLGSQNEVLRTENNQLKQEQNQLKSISSLLEKENLELQKQLNLFKISSQKQIKTKQIIIDQLKNENIKLKTLSQNLTRQNKLFKSQIIKKDIQLKTQKQSYQLKLKEISKKNEKSLSRNKLIPLNNNRVTSNEKTNNLAVNIKPTFNSREKIMNQTPKATSRQKLNISQQLIRPKTQVNFYYKQRKFESPSNKNNVLIKTPGLKIQTNNQQIPFQPSKWKKSPSNKSLEKRPSIRELLMEQKSNNDQSKK